MTEIMDTVEEAIDTARGAAGDLLNIGDRNLGHVALGVAVTVGFALAATLFAVRTVEPRPQTLTDDDAPITERPRGPLSLILPAVFSVTTLSAVRVWNAPSRPERTTALGLWAAAQALNAVWIAMRPSGRGLQITAAMSSAGLAAAFAHEARKLDEEAGKLASPTGGRVRLANFIQRRTGDSPTLH